MTTHEPYEDDDEDRAIARALDVDAPAGAVDEDALDDYQRVLSHLPFDEVAPPGDLEDRVVAAALARRPASATSLEAKRRGRWRVVALSGAVAAAAVVLGFIVFGGDETSDDLGGEIELAANVQMPSGPDVRTAPLEGSLTGTAALSDDGDGAIEFDPVPVPVPYQLQLMTNDGPVVLGTFTPDARIGFRVDGDVDAVRGVEILDNVGREVATATF